MLSPLFSLVSAPLFCCLGLCCLWACTVPPETTFVAVAPSEAEAETVHWYSAQDALKLLQPRLQAWDAQALLYEVKGQWVTQAGWSEDWQVVFISASKQEAISLSLKGGQLAVPLNPEMQHYIAQATRWPASWPDSGTVAMALSQNPGYTFPLALLRFGPQLENGSLHFDWLIQSELDSLYFQALYASNNKPEEFGT